MAGKLTDKQKRFADEYLVDMNATQAAVRAGYSGRSAGSIGWELLQKPAVAAYLSEKQAELRQEMEISRRRVLRELAAISFSRFTDYVQAEDGSLVVKPTETLSEEAAAAVASIHQGRYGLEVKLHDKAKALEQLGKALGVFSPEAEGKGKGGNQVVIVDDL